MSHHGYTSRSCSFDILVLLTLCAREDKGGISSVVSE